MAERPQEVASPLDAEIARLYALAPERFVAERDAVAKRLRAEGDREGAERTRALRKANQPAAAINRAVNADPAAAETLVEAGRRLGDAQREALSAGDASALREASAEHARAVEALMGTVAEELRDAGPGAVDRARETLRAVAVDDDLRAQLQGARVVRDREPVGLGAAGLDPGAPPGRKRRARRGDRERARAERALRAAERVLEAAEHDAGLARERVSRARESLHQAEGERDAALAAREDAESALREAREALGRLDR